MSATISPPVRVFALMGVVAIAALGAFFFLVARPGATPETALPTERPDRTPATTAPKAERPAPARPRTPALQTASGFPPAVDRALRRRGVVVVAVYIPGASVDRVVLTEARAGARASRAPFVAVSAFSERAVRQIVAKTGVLPEPAVVVVKRPGVVTATLGVTDRVTVAQAVALARR